MEKHGKGLISILGPGTVFEGTMQVPHGLHIEGKFKGRIETTETLTVGSSAEIVAEIYAKNAIISGTVHGNIVVENRIELEEKASLIGNLKARELIINEGAVFHGNSSMKEV